MRNANHCSTLYCWCEAIWAKEISERRSSFHHLFWTKECWPQLNHQQSFVCLPAYVDKDAVMALICWHGCETSILPSAGMVEGAVLLICHRSLSLKTQAAVADKIWLIMISEGRREHSACIECELNMRLQWLRAAPAHGAECEMNSWGSCTLSSGRLSPDGQGSAINGLEGERRWYKQERWCGKSPQHSFIEEARQQCCQVGMTQKHIRTSSIHFELHLRLQPRSSVHPSLLPGQLCDWVT